MQIIITPPFHVIRHTGLQVSGLVFFFELMHGDCDEAAQVRPGVWQGESRCVKGDGVDVDDVDVDGAVAVCAIGVAVRRPLPYLLFHLLRDVEHGVRVDDRVGNDHQPYVEKRIGRVEPPRLGFYVVRPIHGGRARQTMG